MSLQAEAIDKLKGGDLMKAEPKICPNCNSEKVELGEIVEADSKTKYYICDDCGRRWFNSKNSGSNIII